MRLFSLIGSVLGLTAVAAGALGAHALEGKLEPDSLGDFQTAARYQLIHAVLLLLPPVAASRVRGGLFTAGVLLFSGSIYLLTLTPLSWVWPLTPIGGILLLAGWFELARHFWTRPAESA